MPDRVDVTEHSCGRMLLQARIIPSPAGSSVDAVSADLMQGLRNVFLANILHA